MNKLFTAHGFIDKSMLKVCGESHGFQALNPAVAAVLPEAITMRCVVRIITLWKTLNYILFTSIQVLRV
jgi:hypothetical protein